MCLGECTLSHVTRISLAENCVTVTWNNLASLEGRPEVLGDSLVAKIVTNRGLHLGEPVQNLLVGKTVERTGETIETSCKGQHGGAESAANQVGGVGTDVSSLVIGVDGKVKSHQLNEVLVLSETKLVGEVVGVILILLDWGNLSALEDVLVNSCGNGWELCDQVHGVLEGVLPVFRLLHSLGISLCESRVVLESGDCDGELCHWVKVAWASVDELLDELGDACAGSPVGRKLADLLLGWDLTSQEKPEET